MREDAGSPVIIRRDDIETVSRFGFALSSIVSHGIASTLASGADQRGNARGRAWARRRPDQRSAKPKRYVIGTS